MTPEQRIAQMPDREVLALCIWREARGEGITGMRAVACSIRNRVKRPRWWGKDWRSVVLKNALVHDRVIFQYSCFNPDDPQHAKFPGPNDVAWADALEIAERLMDGQAHADPTNGGTHYVTRALYESGSAPSWAKGPRALPITAEIGGHIFFLEA